ncbi:MAG: plasmid maintenance system killer protein [Alphaproteobacteria bacterium]|nr:plasmid maintenance system killer protein [Alphaproteobacteria bacterium]
MIKTWKNTATRRLLDSGKNRFSGLDVAKAQTRLAQIHAMDTLDELSPLKSVGLHKLTGSYRGFWAITVNGRYRVVFRFKDGDAYDVEVTDYHK